MSVGMRACTSAAALNARITSCWRWRSFTDTWNFSTNISATCVIFRCAFYTFTYML